MKLLLIFSFIFLAQFVPVFLIKIDETLQSASDSGQAMPDFFLVFNSCPIVEILESFSSVYFKDKYEKNTVMQKAFVQLSIDCKKDVLDFLDSLGIRYINYWIGPYILVINAPPNILTSIAGLETSSIVEVRPDDLQPLAYMPESVTSVKKSFQLEGQPIQNPFYSAAHCKYNYNSTSANVCENLSWGVAKVQANFAWDQGFDGSGIVVSNIDSGVRYTHEALRDNFRGSEYGWYAPYPFEESKDPYTAGFHGTFTMGNLCGKKGIGVAPGAKWISCLACSDQGCPTSAILACFQFISCPTLQNGTNPNCSMAPHIVSNSWGGRPFGNSYTDALRILRIFSIIPIFSIGNSGSSCASAGYPGNSAYVIGVGASRINDTVTWWSSRGPPIDDLTQSPTRTRVKPDISAPGRNIYSSSDNSDNDYIIASGTSFSCPIVAGAVALLLQQNPTLTFNEVKYLLESGVSRPEYFVSTCGGVGKREGDVLDSWPNNSLGYGILNVVKSMNITGNHY